MRRISLALAVFAAIGASYALGRHHLRPEAGGANARRVVYYVDPMHPSYKSDKPGIAPDCGMQLEPVFDSGTASSASPAVQLSPGAVGVDGAVQQLLGVRLAAIEKAGVTEVVHCPGRVFPQDPRVYRVNSGVDGFVEETNQDSVGTFVKKDQKLATYYAPDFAPAIAGFLSAILNVPGAVANDGARTVPFPGALAKQGTGSVATFVDRLRNLGMSDPQIKHMAETHERAETIDVLAPADGFILARNISPGQHFEHNMEFYRIADLAKVWVTAEAPELEARYLRPGANAQVNLRDLGRRLPARVAESLPQSEAGSGLVKIRLELDNPGFILRPDMLVDVEFPVQLPPAITAPIDALVDSGASSRVYVQRSEGVFEPRQVRTGWRFGDRVQILEGLEPGDRVAAGATFLIDSESRLNAPGHMAAGAEAMAASGA